MRHRSNISGRLLLLFVYRVQYRQSGSLVILGNVNTAAAASVALRRRRIHFYAP